MFSNRLEFSRRRVLARSTKRFPAINSRLTMKPEYLDVVCVPVRDLERAKSFYTEVMGFKLVRDVRGGPMHHRWVEVGPEGAKTTIALVDSQFRSRPGPIEGLILKVEDLKEYRSQLEHHGVRPKEIIEETWGSHLSLDDPDGNKWILVDHDITG
jgi:catechol 2,3-dioxygenase-like lactoylglutathione lyase family enzyme